MAGCAIQVVYPDLDGLVQRLAGNPELYPLLQRVQSPSRIYEVLVAGGNVQRTVRVQFEDGETVLLHHLSRDHALMRLTALLIHSADSERPYCICLEKARGTPFLVMRTESCIGGSYGLLPYLESLLVHASAHRHFSGEVMSGSHRSGIPDLLSLWDPLRSSVRAYKHCLLPVDGNPVYIVGMTQHLPPHSISGDTFSVVYRS